MKTVFTIRCFKSIDWTVAVRTASTILLDYTHNNGSAFGYFITNRFTVTHAGRNVEKCWRVDSVDGPPDFDCRGWTNLQLLET